jgi:hypothetical protein
MLYVLKNNYSKILVKISAGIYAKAYPSKYRFRIKNDYRRKMAAIV